MQEIYWNQFLMTGKIEDYLSYRAKDDLDDENQGIEWNQTKQKCRDTTDADNSRKKAQCESDRTDRNGACGSTGGRI